MNFLRLAFLLSLLSSPAFGQAQNQPPGPPIICTNSVVYDASTNGATELVPLTTGRTIYICGYTILAAGTVSVDLRYGTGTACATGGTKLTPAYSLVAQAGISDSAVQFRGMATPVSNALCLNTSAGIAVGAVVFYSKF